MAEQPQTDPPERKSAGTRIVAFDVGARRIGIALSDPLGFGTAHPLLTLQVTGRRDDWRSIGRLIRRHNVTEAVVGHPLHLSGDASPRSALAETFAAQLRTEFHLPVHLVDERLTSHAAHEILDEAGHPRGPGRRRIIDQVAAVLILETFLAERARSTAHETTV
ncbi:MAG: Holliday junction resolvase RuvX [Acidobacteriaceae bacterium]